MAVAEFSFSTFLREPHRVTTELAAHDVVLHRRDGEDLYLSAKSRAERDAESAAGAARMLGALMRRDEGRSLAEEALTEAFPWARFLSDVGRGEFVVDLVDTARGCADLGRWAPLGQLVHEWRAAAAIRADPDLHAALTGPLRGGDHGPVPPPEPGR
jgi:hypothetical protein